jgi:hypothetical protein
MTRFFRGLLFVIALAATASSACAAAPPDSNFYYKLSTAFRGPGLVLDVINGGPQNNMTRLERSQEVTGQFWRIAPAGGGYYRLTTLFRGSTMCLDIHNGGPLNDQPHLAQCANFSGQFWTLTEEGGRVKLKTQFRGPGMCLDIFNGGPSNNQPHLVNCANFSGQQWVLTRTQYPVVCILGAPPSGFDAFYTKHCSVMGLPVLASAEVPDQALEMAAGVAYSMLSRLPRVRDELVRRMVKIGIIGKNQKQRTLPEYRGLDPSYDERARGLGATDAIPMTSGAEENLLCLAEDRYRGESIFLHEFAHTMAEMGLAHTDRNFGSRLTTTYRQAMDARLWGNTYAATNEREYWAEGVQSYFDTNIEVNPPNGIHNHVNTRAELRTYDRRLHDLVDSVFAGTPRPRICP